MRYLNSLPYSEDGCRKAKVLEFTSGAQHSVKNGDLERIAEFCDGLEAALLSGIPDLTDHTLRSLIDAATDLKIIDVSNCRQLSDDGVGRIAVNGGQLKVIRLNSVVRITDSPISAIVRTLPHLAEFELNELPLITASSVQEIWTHGKKLCILRLGGCRQLTDLAFPSILSPDMNQPTPNTNPVPSSQNAASSTQSRALPLLLLPKQHILDVLEFLDLTDCDQITDAAIQGVVAHAPHINHIYLSGCSSITDRGIENLSRLGPRLSSVSLSRLTKITDRSLCTLIQACPKLKTVDVSHCVRLSDLTVLELASLPGLRHLALVDLPNIKHLGLSTLAEQCPKLRTLHIASCQDESIDLEVISLLLRKLLGLVVLDASDIPALKRPGIERFSDPRPSRFKGLYRLFRGENIAKLRRFLDKEDQRRRTAETVHIPFVPRSDDSTALY